MSSVLLLTSVYLLKSGSQYNSNIIKSFGKLQAYYMAVAAMQHAQLKVKYFPTELYDASEYSKGKNPMFDFTILSDSEYSSMSPIAKNEYSQTSPHFHKATMSNLGPRFISDGSLSTNALGKWFQLSSLDVKDSNTGQASWFPSGWPKDKKLKSVKNSDIYLWKYSRDITNIRSYQPALACDNTQVASNKGKLDITTSSKLPYEGTYEISEISVLSTKAQKRLNEEIVSFTGVGSIKLTSNGTPITCEITQRIKVRRQ